MFDIVDDTTTSSEDENASATPGVTVNEEVPVTESSFDSNATPYNTFA